MLIAAGAPAGSPYIILSLRCGSCCWRGGALVGIPELVALCSAGGEAVAVVMPTRRGVVRRKEAGG